MYVTDPIPNFRHLMNPVLQALHQIGGLGTNEMIKDQVAELLQISEDQANMPHNPDKSTQTELEWQLAWAKSYLKKYGIIHNPSPATWAILGEKKDIKRIDENEVVKFYLKTLREQKLTQKKRRRRKPQVDQNYEEPRLFHNIDDNMSEETSDDDFFGEIENAAECEETVSENYFGSQERKSALSSEDDDAAKDQGNQTFKADKEGDSINAIIEYFSNNSNAKIEQIYRFSLKIILTVADDKVELEIMLDPYLRFLNISSYFEYDPIFADGLLRLFSRQDIISTLSIGTSQLRDHFMIRKTIETEKYNDDEIIKIINKIIMEINTIHNSIKSR